MRSFDFAAFGTELLLFLWHLVEIVLKLSTLHITRKTEAGFLYAVFTLLLTLQKTPRTVIFFVGAFLPIALKKHEECRIR